MLLHILSVAGFVALASCQCSFQSGSITANWAVQNNELTIKFVNKNIGNNQWTGIGFGEGMSSLEVNLFKIDNNKLSLVTGFTTGYGRPTIAANNAVRADKLSYNSNTLTAVITRPLGANGANTKDLTGCTTWNFVDSGPLQGGNIGKHSATPTSMRVCPNSCRSQFNARNTFSDPIPQRAIANGNYQSNRWNGIRRY